MDDVCERSQVGADGEGRCRAQCEEEHRGRDVTAIVVHGCAVGGGVDVEAGSQLAWW